MYRRRTEVASHGLLRRLRSSRKKSLSLKVPLAKLDLFWTLQILELACDLLTVAINAEYECEEMWLWEGPQPKAQRYLNNETCGEEDSGNVQR